MGRTVPAVIVGLVLLGVFALMLRAWRARRRRDAGLVTVPVPDVAAVTAAADGFYVATTRGEGTLERLAIPGLSYRGRAHVEVTSAGLVLAVRGEDAVFLPSRDIRGIGTATVTLDRVVEGDGLVVVAWTVHPVDPAAEPVLAETHLRFPDPADRMLVVDALAQLAERAHPEAADPDGAHPGPAHPGSTDPGSPETTPAPESEA